MPIFFEINKTWTPTYFSCAVVIVVEVVVVVVLVAITKK